MRQSISAGAALAFFLVASACSEQADTSEAAATASADVPAETPATETHNFIPGPDGIIDTSVCDIRDASEALDGKKIRVHARYVDINSYAMLGDMECKNFALRMLRTELDPSDAVFDHSTEFLENVILHGSTKFFTDDIDVFGDFVGTYMRKRDEDYHVLMLDSVSDISYEERPAE